MVDVDVINRFRIATEDELARLGLVPFAERLEAIRALRARGVLVPVRGASPDDAADGAGDGDGDDGKKDDDAAGDGDGKKDDDAGDDADAELRAKLAKAEKAAADKDRELRDIRRKQEERDREARESEGKFEELYNEEKKAREAAEKALEDFKAEVDSREATNAAKAQAIAALKAAGLKNPERDVVHLDLSKVDSETAAKRIAKKFADENPDLLDKPPTRQKRGGGTDDGDKSDERGREAVGPERLRRHFANR